MLKISCREHRTNETVPQKLRKLMAKVASLIKLQNLEDVVRGIAGKLVLIVLERNGLWRTNGNGGSQKDSGWVTSNSERHLLQLKKTAEDGPRPTESPQTERLIGCHRRCTRE